MHLVFSYLNEKKLKDTLKFWIAGLHSANLTLARMFLASDSAVSQTCYVTQQRQSLPKRVTGEEHNQLEQQKPRQLTRTEGAGVGEMHHEGRTTARFKLMSETAITKEHSCKGAQTSFYMG